MFVRASSSALPAGVAASGVGFRRMIREGEQVFPEQLFEPGSGGLELFPGLFESILGKKHVGKTPADLRITAREGRHKQMLGRARLTLARVDLRQVDTRPDIARHVSDRASIPALSNFQIGFGCELSPQHAELKADVCDRKRREAAV